MAHILLAFLGTATDEQLHEAFQTFDHQQDGTVHTDQLKSALTQFGHEPFSAHEMQAFVVHSDPKATNSIHYGQLLQNIKNNRF